MKKSTGNCGFTELVTFTEEILNGKHHLNLVTSYEKRKVHTSTPPPNNTLPPTKWRNKYIYHPCASQPSTRHENLVVNIPLLGLETGALQLGSGSSVVVPLHRDQSANQ